MLVPNYNIQCQIMDSVCIYGIVVRKYFIKH